MIEYRDMLEMDIEKLTSILEVSFNNISKKYINCDYGPYGYNDGSLLRRLLKDKKVISQVIIYKGIIIGSYSIRLSNNQVYLELLYLDTKYQDMGIGSKVMKYLEDKYFITKRCIIDVMAYAYRSQCFFTKCGFRKLKDECCDDICLSIYVKN